ncbi:MAG: hypothetical protein AAGA08_04080 [Pseudomonadota bacterium]
MGKVISSAIGAAFSVVCFSSAWADTVALALRAPLPSVTVPLPSLPPLEPVRFDQTAASPVQDVRPSLSAVIAKQADINAFGFPCETTLKSHALPNAMIAVSIFAPCKPYQTVSISYAGLEFDLSLSMTGATDTVLPALTRVTELTVRIGPDTKRSTRVDVSDIDGFMRVALEWPSEGPPLLSGTAPRHMPVDRFILGDPSGRTIQIVSHPLDPETQPGVIRLQMNQTVTAQNCAEAQTGRFVQMMAGFTQQVYDLTLAAPGCDKIGHSLELKNILQDLKLASN